MSQYTVPRRAISKRNLSHRARIVLLASLLLPVLLLAVAKAPVHANPSGNPIFATMQDVQNAINTALAPINNAIASLQEQQTKQSQQISSLQNAGSKAFHVYDANGQELGITFDGTGTGANIYSPALQRFIYLSFTSYSIDGDFSSAYHALYQSADCSGTPYLLATGAIANNPTNNLLPVSPNAFYIIPDSAAPTTVSIHSEQSWDPNTNLVSCSPNTISNTQAYQLQQVDLPFTVPLALPLHFKYQ
jgi:hypothetical protein